MKHRYLGNSGLRISEISFGNWLTHGSQVNDNIAIRTIHTAIEHGITTFDTADVYSMGKAEEVMGRALSTYRRSSLEIFTKVYWPVGEGVNDRGLSRKHIMEGINNSLSRLKTDYVDLYQAHRYDYETPLEETMLAFADIIRAGKALYIGVSEWTAEEIEHGKKLADELHIPFISSQPQYSMLHRVIEKRVIPKCEKLGISQIVWSPLAQGILTGKYKAGAPAPKGSRGDNAQGKQFMNHFLGFNDDALNTIQKLQPLADSIGLSMGQMAIAWVLQNNNVASAIIGASKPEQIVENVKASGVILDKTLMDKIDDILKDIIIDDPNLTKSPKPRA